MSATLERDVALLRGRVNDLELKVSGLLMCLGDLADVLGRVENRENGPNVYVPGTADVREALVRVFGRPQ